MALTDKLTAIADAIRSKNGLQTKYTVSQMSNAIRELNAPFDEEEFNGVNSVAENYLSASAAYSADNYDVSVVGDYASTTERNDLPASHSLSLPSGCASVTVIDSETGAGITEAASGSYTVENLIPNRIYYCFAADSLGRILKAGSFKALGALRMISADRANGLGTFNIRDIGGRSCDGGMLRYGRVFRGCQLNSIYTQTSLSAAQVTLLRDFLGIADEIDLRSEAETAGQDRIPGTSDDFNKSALGESVGYIWVPVAPYASGVKLSDSVQTQYYKTLLKRVAKDLSEGKPCYIHCVEGADRTGTLCALIEAICGVSQTDIDRGYELTSLAQNRARYRNGSEWKSLITYLNTLEGSTFRDKAVNYALRAGVSIDEINAIRTGLTDGAPQQLTSPFSALSVTKTLSNVTSDSSVQTAERFQPLKIALSPNSGYVISGITVTMGDEDITGRVFTGTKVNLLRNVKNTLTNCTVDNAKATVIDGESFATIITPDSGYTLDGAIVTINMGGINVSEYYSNGVIAIPSVTGDIVITATAAKQAAQNLFVPETASLSSRINSSGAAVAADSALLVSDYIELPQSGTLMFESDRTQDVNTYAGQITLYNSSKTKLEHVYKGNSGWTWDSEKKTGSISVEALRETGTASSAAYIRMCVGYTDINNISIVIE